MNQSVELEMKTPSDQINEGVSNLRLTPLISQFVIRGNWHHAFAWLVVEVSKGPSLHLS